MSQNIALYTALAQHSATPERSSKLDIQKEIEAAWGLARIRTIPTTGLTSDIVAGVLININSRSRTKFISNDQFNTMINIVTLAHSAMSQFYVGDSRAVTLNARLTEAYRANRLDGGVF